MDRVNAKMKKLGRVLDGFRASVSQSPRLEWDIEESLRSDHFQVAKTVLHGFPYQPTALAFDPVQRLLAIGTKTGSLRIFGRPGVDCHVKHDGDVTVIQILFLVNEGALISVCSNDELHLWTLRQKRPELVHSLKFQRERITCCHLPFQSKWLYIGTEKGNVHIANIESFVLSGYVINWNKAIELSRKTHPGQVLHLSGNPVDPNKLLIGFESGTLVLWDLRSKAAEGRFNCSQPLRSVTWQHEGKQFICSHTDGTLTTWNIKIPQKALSSVTPHGKTGRDGQPEPCRLMPIMKVEWKSVRNSEPFTIFSGGMPSDQANRSSSLTVIHGKSTTVLEMKHNVVDFITLCSSPWSNDVQEPYAIVVLLEDYLVLVDLLSPGYPCFENPYPMDIHESPVTACQYYADCPHDLIPAFYYVGSKQKKTGFSDKEWPVNGGAWGKTTCSYPEIIITGHADGSLKFWAASSVTLQLLYKLKTAKLFEKTKDLEDDPFAIQHIILSCESRILCVAGSTHVILFRFSKQEMTIDNPNFLEIPIVYEIYDELDSPEMEFPPITPKPSIGTVHQQSGSFGSYSSAASEGKGENVTSLKVKTNGRKWQAGYQPDLTCLLCWLDGECPPPITSIQFNSRYGLLAFGNECGLAIVDFIQKTCLWSMGTPNLYGSMDPYSRAPRSPKGKQQMGKPSDSSALYSSEECKSPTSDQSFQDPPASPVSPGRGRRISQGSHLEAISEANNQPGTDEPDTCPEPDTANLKLDLPKSKLDTSSLDSATEVTEEGMVQYLESQSEENLQQGEKSNKNKKKPVLSHSQSDLSPVDVNPQKSHMAVRRTRSDTETMKRSSKPDEEDQSGEYDWSKNKDCKSQSEKFRRSQSNNENEQNAEDGLTSTYDNISKYFEEFQNNNSVVPSKETADTKETQNTEVLGHTGEDSSKHRTRGMLRKMSRKIKKTFVKKEVSDVVQDVLQEAKEADVSSDSAVQAEVIKPEVAPREHVGLLRMMSQKLRLPRDEDQTDKGRKRSPLVDEKFSIIDLTSDNLKEEPVTRRINYITHAMFDKNDGSFSRSRSSSMSSLENINKEAIQCLMFADAYTRKQDAFTSPCLWVGTSLGSVLVIVLNLAAEGEQRKTQPVIITPSGTIFRLKGSITAMSFMDCNGLLIPALTEQWRDDTREEKERKVATSNRPGQTSVSSMRPRMSPTQSTEISDRQLAIICSEKQARVMSLPSQTCAFKVKITETSFVAKAEIVTFRDSVCLACYIANGHIMTFGLPSLRPLLDICYLPLTDIRIAKTFTFSNNGHALYFCSPTELQKLTISGEHCENLNEMLGELFLPCDMPEAPKQSFFKNLFGGGSSTLDRESLFGEESGKASKSVAKYTPGHGMAQAQDRAGSAASAISQARQAALERGEKLGQLEDTSERMRQDAEMYAKLSHDIMNKYKDKKWYQF